MREAGTSEDQTQAQADMLNLKSQAEPRRYVRVTPSGGASTPARGSSGSEGEEEASVMEPEPLAAVVKRRRAPTPMDEEVKAKIMQLPIKEQRRSFLKILTKAIMWPSTATQATADYTAWAVATEYRTWTIRFSVLLARSCLGFHVRSLLSLLVSFRAAGPETSDSGGTSEVSPESEPGDQSGAGATFLG